MTLLRQVSQCTILEIGLLSANKEFKYKLAVENVRNAYPVVVDYLKQEER